MFNNSSLERLNINRQNITHLLHSIGQIGLKNNIELIDYDEEDVEEQPLRKLSPEENFQLDLKSSQAFEKSGLYKTKADDSDLELYF